ncbi:LamG-like jellyroll fold domain-containing protein [Asanoa siamensis]|uniref:LamG-like jellyroll fold domain-containing protein n=1 Tax=Asanoa siamensis TaxID=926357 RepID=A0ABQ4D3C6_9ACTN|nr:LamG-like jellyroll fold domain-containing protein [Asanoa siamensis]GIF78009.1 hypothetical protein Asi02nite_75270 [Asanoa siamensis]
MIAVPVPVGAATPAEPAPPPVAGPAGSVASAAAQALATGRRVEVTSERGEASTVYANPDGSLTTDFTVAPTRVRRGDGWVGLDTALRRESTGAVVPSATTVPLRFSGGGNEPLVRIGSAGARVELRWPATLPAPELAGDTATYREIMPGVDLRLQVKESGGFGKVFVVKSREAATNPALARLRLPLAVTGLTPRVEAGIVGFYNGAGERVFATGAPMMWDAAQRTGLARMKLVDEALVVEPDLAFLTGPSTRYPVLIDPDVAPTRNSWLMVLSGHPDQAYPNGSGDNRAKVGRCYEDGTCAGIGVARSYFQFNTGDLRGKDIIRASFRAVNDWAPSCTAKAVDAFGTDHVNGGTTWRTQPWTNQNPGLHLGTRTEAWGRPGCDAHTIEWPATSIVAWSAGNNRTLTTIVLKARNEGDQLAWKKFATKPVLSVTYNTRPALPYNVRVEGLACTAPPGEAQVHPMLSNNPDRPRGPRMSAYIADEDGGNVEAQFIWYDRDTGQQLGATNVHDPSSPVQASGTRFEVDVPAAHAAHGRKLFFRARGWDGVAWGPVGPACHVTIDRTAPGSPQVSSATYPKCDFQSTCDPAGAVGRAGTFTFVGGTDVAGFRYGMDDQTPLYVAANSSGQASLLITPPKDNVNDLFVRSVDRAGNVSGLTLYQFAVGAGTPPTGRWRLDGIAETRVPDDAAGRRDGTVTLGPVAWRTGRHGDALWFDGVSGHVNTTNGPAVQTSRSFSVSAWVKLDRLDTDWRTAVSQDGSQISGFFLQYNGSSKRWNFTIPAANETGAARRVAESATPAVPGRWTHLVGVYDLATKTARLYVDGAVGTTGVVSHPTPWSATGTLQIGRARQASGPFNYWPGSVDDVRVYDRVLSAVEVTGLATLPANEEVFLPFDEGAGASTQDVSGNYRPGAVGTAVTWTEGVVGSGAVRLDGGTDTVRAAGPVVRTDSSFTVSARVRVPAGAEGETGTVLSQDGGRRSGFVLGHREGNWRFEVPEADSDTARPVTASSGSLVSPNEWTHLTGVYDAPAKMLRLFVNGRPAGSANLPGTFQAWNAGGALNVGRGLERAAPAAPLRGDVDDVHVWTGTRSEDMILEDHTRPVTGRPGAHTGQIARFKNVGGYHVVTTGPVPTGSHFEGSLGVPAPNDAENTVTIRSCRNGSRDYLLAYDCGNGTDLGAIGKLYADPPPADVETVPIYRCAIRNGGTHFAAHDSGCEGQVMEELLGHARAYRHLVRHAATGYPYDHTSATANVPSTYRAEGNLGLLATFQQPGTTTLWRCQKDTDTFSSVEPGCEGGTTLAVVGHVWSTPPPDLPSGELFRCRASATDLFDSRDRGCEGRAFDRSLGYVVTALPEGQE